MNKYDDIDKRGRLGLATGLVVFIIAYVVLIILYGGWGAALGWIVALAIAAPAVYAIYRSEPLARFVSALMTSL
jgi:Mg/Co/Ni transporter MgtE